ncbi:hypothetical protein ACFSUS_01400 [Spirosoma soli]|uniref:Lipoprotein n=1 Tax=Spirosoma soli TaxID=1770529 RepID=A0ABW5LWU5_9BACT
MKRLIKTLSFALFATVSTALISCNHANEATPKQPSGTATQTNQAEYQRLMNARQQYTGVTFDITSVQRQGDVLTIQVKGGCSADNYKVVWNGYLMQSYPMQTNLVVAYEGNSNCSTPGAYTLTVDLKALLGSVASPSETQVQVSNGSKVKDVVVDPSGVVSNK